MPENENIETPPETPAETPENLPEGKGTEEPADDAQKPTEGDEKPQDEKPALTPEQLAKELADTRKEAANYRTRLRDTEAKLAEAKTLEEFDQAIAEFKSNNARLEREITVTRIAAKYELPDSLAARLVGDDEAALEADAKALAALVNNGRPAGNLTGGLTPNESDDDFDPVAAAHAAKQRRW